METGDTANTFDKIMRANFSDMDFDGFLDEQFATTNPPQERAVQTPEENTEARIEEASRDSQIEAYVFDAWEDERFLIAYLQREYNLSEGDAVLAFHDGMQRLYEEIDYGET